MLKPRKKGRVQGPLGTPPGAGRPVARPQARRNTAPMGPAKGVNRSFGFGAALGSNAPQYKAPAAPKPVQYGQVAAPVAPTAVAPPETVGAAGIRANAEQAWQQAQTGNRDAIFRAAMNLGDPAVIAQLQANPEFAGYQFAQDPNSVFSQLNRNEETGLKDIGNARNNANTFFSGFRLNDQNMLREDIGRQRLAGSTDYQDNLRQFAAALAKARGDYDLANSEANQMDIDAATALEPVDEAGPSAPAVAPAPAKGVNRGKSNPARAQHKAASARAKTESAAAVAESKAKKKARKR